MKFYTFDPAKQKKVLIGNIEGGILYKEVKPYHFMRIVDGYGIQHQAFEELYSKVKRIVIIEESGDRWEATPSEWKKNGKVMDFGNGKQIFLSLKFMHRKVDIDKMSETGSVLSGLTAKQIKTLRKRLFG